MGNVVQLLNNFSECLLCCRKSRIMQFRYSEVVLLDHKDSGRGVAQLVRALVSDAEGRRFKSYRLCQK